MKLVVGLGNPGKKYQNSKHNIGYMVLDSYAKSNNIKYRKSIKFTSEVAVQDNLILLKPKTFMNNSGNAVRRVSDYYKILPEDILVVSDELNLPFLKLRLRGSGSAGGHNGIKSIIRDMNTEEFKRLRIGIGRNSSVEMKNDVLSDFNKAEMKNLNDKLGDLDGIINDFISGQPFDTIMNKYN